MGEWTEPLRLLHFLAASVLFGTRLGGAYYLWRADRSGDPAVIGDVARNLLVAELVFTTPAVLVQLVTGLALAEASGLTLATPWLAAGLGLFTLVGLAWVPLLGLQVRIARIARDHAGAAGSLPVALRRPMRLWHVLEWPVFAAVIAIFWLMVFRPTLP